MRKALRAVLLTILTAAPCIAQTLADGEITGRITDGAAAVLPGVRIEIALDTERRQAVTDSDGLFTLRGLELGTYRVTAQLLGFRTLSGTLTLSSAIRRAHIAWPLTVGCIEEDIRVIPSPRDAAAEASIIARVRIESDDGQLLVSTRPECPGAVAQTYTVAIVDAVVRRAKRDDGRSTVRLSRSPRDARLQVGGEYLAILWPSTLGEGGLLFPIVSGRVSAPDGTQLNEMRLEDALKRLRDWSRERPR